MLTKTRRTADRKEKSDIEDGAAESADEPAQGGDGFRTPECGQKVHERARGFMLSSLILTTNSSKTAAPAWLPVTRKYSLFVL